VSALEGGSGEVDLLEVVQLPRELRRSRLTMSAMQGTAEESGEVALTAVTRWVEARAGASERGQSEHTAAQKQLVAVDWHAAFVEPSMRQSDGASGGLCIALGMVSALYGRPLPASLAVTGSLSLHGHVMQVGSIHEKATACALRGMTTLMLPEGCRADWSGLPDAIQAAVTPVFVDTLDAAIDHLWRS
jgi:ATP-dependent Lon protease